ncbi:hypothetical protein WR25_10197 [Diploscapter pachys]|uniref:Uncharacterized protein n=1 Tax=Diploscapter pachys TaxID=2018661 RepID=A0A2A2M584_9BILA|nr:hypothetical protein WR25_10197 [Diploscapter pachys]
MASRSVGDIGGRTRWNQLNIGAVNSLRRSSGRAKKAALTAITTQISASSQPGAGRQAPVQEIRGAKHQDQQPQQQHDSSSLEASVRPTQRA